MAEDDRKKPLSDEEALQEKVDSYMKPARAAEHQPDGATVHGGEEIHNIPVTINKNALPDPKDLPLPATAPLVPGARKVAEPAQANPGTQVKPDNTAAGEKTAGQPDEAPVAMPEEGGLDTPENDKAVDDIAAKESDLVLAVNDAKAAKSAGKAAKPRRGFKQKLKAVFRNKWTWLIIGLLLIVLLAVPYTRYKVLGLLVKKPVTVTVMDATSNTPVSSAQVTLGGASGKTEANGKVTLRAGVGPHDLEVSKSYYKTSHTPYSVSFDSEQKTSVELTATGRLVPVSVRNSITGQPVGGAQVKVLNTAAKTDGMGKALIALPATKQSYEATITYPGFNQANVTVQVTNQAVKANEFTLTPAGQVYFLSNKSGTIDVVRTNLDGSDRKVILEGTGKETADSTSLIASRDWRYLALKAQRDGNRPSLYLIDTKTGKSTQFDNGNAEFNVIGWQDHYFVYSLSRNNHNAWEQGGQAIKSYDADRQQLNILDQTQAQGSSNNQYASQGFANFFIMNDMVVYSVQWYGVNADMNNLNSSIRGIKPNGTNKKDYQTLPAASISSIEAVMSKPESIYYAVYNISKSDFSYYEFDGSSVQSSSGIDMSTFRRSYPVYLASPSGKQTFWSELRDGKNSLFTGDANGENEKLIAGNTEYTPFGWYGNSYVLVTKDKSELYVMPVGGLENDLKPLKITDYYKISDWYKGYGYGWL